MYPNLKAEMARRGITYKMIAKKLHLTESTVCRKASGKSYFTFDETLAVRNYVNPAMDIETLFERAEARD